jgi:hypothetical protein
MATTLGLTKISRLLTANLKEELGAAKKITAAGAPIMKESALEPEEPKKQKTGKEKYSAKKSKEDEARMNDQKSKELLEKLAHVITFVRSRVYPLQIFASVRAKIFIAYGRMPGFAH